MTIDENTETFVFVAALASARSGESGGFDLLFERFAQEIYLLGACECYSEPESLVDIVMSQAFEQIRSFVGSEPAFAGLLFKLSMEQIVKERAAYGLEPDEHVSCGQANFDEHVASERIVELHDGLHWLSFDERKMLHLRLTFGLNLLQAARVLDVSIPEARAVQASVERTLTDSNPDPVVEAELSGAGTKVSIPS